ncbi:MAG TPA: ATP synthase subunit I [Xanthobacteraceae bacterium]|nr:ATP synthase subunit I [Xanthobacteraceae bacterium]
MNEFLFLAPPLAAGLLLGAVFFGGLWWTVIRAFSSQRPALWFFGSMLLRMSITLAGFYFVGGGNWKWCLLCLIGFVLARLVVKWSIRPPHEHHDGRALETSYAP